MRQQYLSQVLCLFFSFRTKNNCYIFFLKIPRVKILKKGRKNYKCYNRSNNPNRKENTMKQYGFWNFATDVMMTSLTCGFWLIWVFVREVQKLKK